MTDKRWDISMSDTRNRLSEASKFIQNQKFVSPENAVQLLQTIIKSGDVVALEGDNQKQADFLAK